MIQVAVERGCRLRWGIAAAGMLLFLSSCGSGSTGPRDFVFTSEFVLNAADDDLAQAVVVDSVRWIPTATRCYPSRKIL